MNQLEFSMTLQWMQAVIIVLNVHVYGHSLLWIIIFLYQRAYFLLSGEIW